MVLKITRDELPITYGIGCVRGMPSLSPLSSLGNRLEKNVRRKNLEEGGGGGGVGWLAFTLSRSLDNNLIKGK